MPHLYIIAGCNGAGKTTASYSLLPDVLGCKEFVNADEIARGLSPFNVESVAFQAGRIMLERIRELMKDQVDFAVETTLATKIYVGIIREARQLGYTINLNFFWLIDPKLAIQRVANRVANGGHNIPEETILKRYALGITYFMNIYKDLADYSTLFDNSASEPELIAEFQRGSGRLIWDSHKFAIFTQYGAQ